MAVKSTSRLCGLLGMGLAGVAGATLMLAGCGNSHVARATSRSRSRTQSVANSTRSQDGICHSVKQPEPREEENLTKPKLQIDPSKSYRVRLVTNCGDIEIKLDAAQAPTVVASFVHLVQIGFYDNLTFHRVVAGFVIQGGDPKGNGSGGPGYTVAERPPSNIRYTKGTVAMAKDPSDPPGTAGSQFFIVVGKDIDLPPQYAVLGKVVGGQQTVNAIARIPTTVGAYGEDSEPSQPIVISKATVKIG
jgi:peptidyl-prolyl cis-trans isomerase B (cyclophilin B)